MLCAVLISLVHLKYFDVTRGPAVGIPYVSCRVTTHAQNKYKIILKEVIPKPQHEEHYNEYINNLNLEREVEFGHDFNKQDFVIQTPTQQNMKTVHLMAEMLTLPVHLKGDGCWSSRHFVNILLEIQHQLYSDYLHTPTKPTLSMYY